MTAITTDFRRAALREGMIIRPSRSHDTDTRYRAAVSAELMSLGYLVNPEDLSGMSLSALGDLITDARAVMDADRNHTPFYPGFPQQVREMDTMDLLMDQILHYFSRGTWRADRTTVVRPEMDLEDMVRRCVPLTVCRAGDAARKILDRLSTSVVAYSVQEKTLLREAMTVLNPSVDEVAALASQMRHHENMQSLVSSSSANRLDLALAVLPVVRGADGLLRVMLSLYSKCSNSMHQDAYDRAVTTLSDSDAYAVSMISAPKAVRRALVSRLGQVCRGTYFADDVLSRRQLWLRVMRSVHPYSLSGVESAHDVLDVLHDNVTYQTFNSAVESALAARDVTTAVSLLTDRPGALLRRVVALLAMCDTDSDARTLADAVRQVGAKSTTSTLVSCYNGVVSINDSAQRLVRVAGRNNSMVSSAQRDVPVGCVAFVISALTDALTEALSECPAPTGTVPVGGDAPMPLVRRDASVTDQSMDRGARITPVGSGDTIRLFVQWYNIDNDAYAARVDLDLGAVLLDRKCQFIDTVTWDSWYNSRGYATYSGDITNAPRPEGAAEYIDIDVDKARKIHPTARYAAMTVVSYTGQKIGDVDHHAGVMYRSKTNSGEVFSPRTVSTSFTSTTKSTSVVPLVFDLTTGEAIWIDSSTGSSYGEFSVASDNSISSVVYNEVCRTRLSAGEFARMWAKAHNVKVDESTPADTDSLVALLES